jgi:hypothetical protein
MRVELLNIKGTWREIADSARTTIGKGPGELEPSEMWKIRMLMAEHSPIRQMQFRVKIYDLKSWISVHFVRHKIGIEHYISTQRTDRTGIDRDSLRQDNLVDHEMIINVQALINISRKRRCFQASRETLIAWNEVLDVIKKKEPLVYAVCVSECIYRGWCPEFKSCDFSDKPIFKQLIKNYRNLIKPPHQKDN